jgi:hypothetical protein
MMNRRGFLRSLLQASALVAAAKVGLGNLTAETIAELCPDPEFTWFGAAMRVDPNMPPNEIWFISKDALVGKITNIGE